MRARAAEHKYNDVEGAAAQLTKMISSNSGVNAVLPKKVVFFDLNDHPVGGAIVNRPVAISDGMSRSSTVSPTPRPAKR